MMKIKLNITIGKIKILGSIGVILGFFGIYQPKLNFYGKGESSFTVTQANLDKDSTFKILVECTIEIQNNTLKPNNIKDIKIIPFQNESTIEKIESIKIDNSFVYPFQTKLIRYSFWMKTKELMVVKNCDSTYKIQTFPLRVFFLDRNGNQIENINQGYPDFIDLVGYPSYPEGYDWIKWRLRVARSCDIFIWDFNGMGNVRYFRYYTKDSWVSLSKYLK